MPFYSLISFRISNSRFVIISASLTINIIQRKRYSYWPVAYTMRLSVGRSGKCTVENRLIGSGCRLGWWVESVEGCGWQSSKGKGQFLGVIWGVSREGWRRALSKLLWGKTCCKWNEYRCMYYRSLSMMVLIRWATVSTVQSANSRRIVSCISSSVSMSTAAVASSRTRIFVLRSSVRARQISCFCPTLTDNNGLLVVSVLLGRTARSTG